MKFLIILITTLLFSHPLNLTKMELNLSNNILKVRFVSFNLIKDLNLSSSPTSKDVLKRKDDIFAYTKKHIIFENCNLTPLTLNVKNEIVIDEFFKLKCKNFENIKVKFDMFFDFDKTQQGVLRVFDKNESVFLFTPSKTMHIFNKKTLSFFDFVGLGIEHILTGFDHLTFLLMLILPVIAFFNLKKSLIQVLAIASMFTFSHSITLSLSAFNILNPPERLIESLIAFSIFLTAINNIFHFVSYKKEWLLGFLFGFIHGFGFANALKEIHLSTNNFAKVVFGFNIGVEIGQILVIVFILPLLYFLIKKYFKIYYLLVGYGLIVSFLWMIDRIFNFNFMPF